MEPILPTGEQASPASSTSSTTTSPQVSTMVAATPSAAQPLLIGVDRKHRKSLIITLAVIVVLILAILAYGYATGFSLYKEAKRADEIILKSKLPTSLDISLLAYKDEIAKLDQKPFANASGSYQINFPIGWQGMIDTSSGDTVGVKGSTQVNSATSIMVHTEKITEEADLMNEDVQDVIALGIVDQFLLNGSEQTYIGRVSPNTIVSEMRSGDLAEQPFNQSAFIHYSEDRIDIVLVTAARKDWMVVKPQLYASALTFKLTK